MHSINQNFSTADNLRLFKNRTNLIKGNKIPILFDTELHVIIVIREDKIINFEKTRKSLTCDEPFVLRCKIGWAGF